jgi:steroid delta-isomerase-like uncharacterized protein
MQSRLLLVVPFFAACVAGCGMQPGEILANNKTIVLRSEAELWSKGDLAVANELYSPDYVCHFIVGPEWKGIEGIKNVVKTHRASFPDWFERVDDIVAEGDKVVIRFTSTGTQQGAFEGIAPTGKKVSIQEIAIFRLANGKIVEQWGIPDVHGLLLQLSPSSGDNQQTP